MKLVYYSCCLIFGLILTGCQNNSPDEVAVAPDLKEEMKGTWQTVQINVAINSADGRDTFRTESFTENVWRANNIQPPFYYFQSDQKYRCVRKNVAGEVIDELEGSWNVFGDTLVLVQPDLTEKYLVKSGSGRATWRIFRDWDDDGEADDEYQELLRKISIGTN
jgi:hypothetical protein